MTEPDPAEGLYVPVTNLSYIPEGGGTPQGFVPGHPADDPVLNRIKDSLEAQGLESGTEVDPGEGAPEADEDEVSPTDESAEEAEPEPETGEVAEEKPSRSLF